MNQAPYLLPGARFGLRMNDSTLVDSMIRDGLWCALNDYHMGITAENIAQQYHISRQQQMPSPPTASTRPPQPSPRAYSTAKSSRSPVKTRKETIDFAIDEHPRASTTVESLAKLRAAFQKDGTVTAGNASGHQ